MPEFQMIGKCEPEFRALDEFTQGYIEAMFFTSEAPGVSTEEWQATEEHDEGSIPCDVGAADLADEALAAIVADCAKWQLDNAALLSEAYERDYEPEQAGRDYWFTRNGHGVGFWDREQLEPDDSEYERLTAIMIANRDDNAAWGAALAERNKLKAASIGQRLSDACRHRDVDCYLGDDGKVYVS